MKRCVQIFRELRDHLEMLHSMLDVFNQVHSPCETLKPDKSRWRCCKVEGEGKRKRGRSGRKGLQ